MGGKWPIYCKYGRKTLISSPNISQQAAGCEPSRHRGNLDTPFRKVKFTGPEATNVCQDEKLCSGLRVVIDIGIHGVQAIWDANSPTENWFLLIVDARNTFNKINCIGMLWTVCHLCPSKDIFVFNCYLHWSSFILQNYVGHNCDPGGG